MTRTKKNTNKQQDKPYYKKLLSPKSGTATSSPSKTTASQTNKVFETPSQTKKVFDTLLNMKKNAYADTIIKATGKRLRHLELNTKLNNPEQVKGYIATKNVASDTKKV